MHIHLVWIQWFALLFQDAGEVSIPSAAFLAEYHSDKFLFPVGDHRNKRMRALLVERHQLGDVRIPIGDARFVGRRLVDETSLLSCSDPPRWANRRIALMPFHLLVVLLGVNVLYVCVPTGPGSRGMNIRKLAHGTIFAGP